MKNLFLLLFLFSISCTESEKTEPKTVDSEETNESKEIIKTEFQAILDSAGVKGSILVFSENNYFSNDFDWAKTGHLPASTFKIPNSIIALELGIMANDSTVIPWDGQPKYQKRWEQDLTFKEAFHASCVPCYQEIARKVGVERMKNFTADFNYGNLDFDSTNLDMFWLEGKSKIDQFQQISFLKSLNERQFNISERTYNLMSKMMIIEETNDYTLRGKSGWSFQDSIDNCWFVGSVETKKGIVFFATNIEPRKDTDQEQIPFIRQNVTMEALKSLGYPIKK